MIQATIIILSLIGLGITIYQGHVRKNVQDTAPGALKEHHPVAHIKSVLFLEIPLEQIVMGYFIGTALVYGGLLLTAADLPGLDLTIMYLSAIIFLLLIYNWVMVLGIVGRFSFRVLSFIILSGGIFMLTCAGMDVGLIPLLVAAFPYSITLHLLGVILGLGGALILDVMIFHFLRNFAISRRESVIMHLLSQMIVLGLIFLLISGVALLFSDPEAYLESPRFLMKMTVVLVIIVNGVVLNLYITPKMERISFQKEAREENQTLIYTSFIVGAISGVSWFSAYLLAMLEELGTFSYGALLTVYLLLLASGIGGGLMKKKKYEERVSKELPDYDS